MTVRSSLERRSESIFYLCEISYLLLFVSYFASQRIRIELDDYFFDGCCVN